MKIINTTPFTDEFLLKVSKGKDECKGYDGIVCYFQETLIKDEQFGDSYKFVLYFHKDKELLGAEILIMSAKNFDNIRSLGFKKDEKAG